MVGRTRKGNGDALDMKLLDNYPPLVSLMDRAEITLDILVYIHHHAPQLLHDLNLTNQEIEDLTIEVC